MQDLLLLSWLNEDPQYTTAVQEFCTKKGLSLEGKKANPQ